MKIFISSVFGMLVALSGLAQNMAGAPVQVSVQVSFHAYLIPEGAYVPAPADMFIHPILEPSIPMHAGDSVMIDFFGDGKKLSSAKAVWHDATPHMVPGQAQPAYILPPQFMVPNCVWTNVSQGVHVVKIQAHGLQGFSASAGPVHFTVLPPIPPQPPEGTHTLTGKQRPAAKPESVKVFRVAPQGTYEVVGKVTARVSSKWPEGTPDALAEIRKQAAQLGANGVIVDNVNHSDGMPFSGPNKIFSIPMIRMAGRAIYTPPTQ
jgi:uncharacterized protein YbjQ (UPF0145 family)